MEKEAMFKRRIFVDRNILIIDPMFGATTYKINAHDFDGKVAYINGKQYVLRDDGTKYFYPKQEEARMSKRFQPRYKFNSDKEWMEANGTDPKLPYTNLTVSQDADVSARIKASIKKSMEAAKEITR